MSQTRNQTTTVGPDAAGAAYLGQARDAAQQAYQNTLAQPYFTGDRSADINPLQMQAADYAQQQAGLFGGAAQGLQAQAGMAGNANNYFGAQQQAGYGGLQQQQNMLAGGYGAQDYLQNGLNAGYGGLNTIGQANSLFGAGAQGQMAQAGQLNPYLQQSRALTQNGALGALQGQVNAGLGAQGQVNAFGQNAAQTGFNAATGALNGAPDASQFFNPFQSQVLDATRQQFGQVRDATNRNISDRATAAGAFGGSREAVTRGAALADIARNETSQLAGLTAQGYTDAMNRAMQQQQFQSQAGQSLFNQGLGALGQQAGYGQQALGQQVGLYGQGLNNLGQAGMQGSNSLFSSGLGAGQYLAGQGQQNAGTLYGGANNAGQFLGTQGSYGANQQGGFANDAQNRLFGAGITGAGQLGQYGGLFQGYNQNAIDRNVAGMDDPIRRQQQALGMFGAVGIPQGGQTSTTPVTRNYLQEGLGYAGLIGGIAGGPLGGLIGSGVGRLFGGGTTTNPFDLGGSRGVPTYNPYGGG